MRKYFDENIPEFYDFEVGDDLTMVVCRYLHIRTSSSHSTTNKNKHNIHHKLITTVS